MSRECPQCKHPMTDYWTFDACTFCKYTEKKNIIVIDKEFNPHDYHSMGDAIEYVWQRLVKDANGKRVVEVTNMIIESQHLISRLMDLRLNLVSGQVQAMEIFIKQYFPYIEFLKQQVDRQRAEEEGEKRK